MTTANGSRHSLGYVVEVVAGTTPATPAFKPLRMNSTNLSLSKGTLQSAELRNDRQLADVRHGNYQVGGDFVVDLSFDSFADMLEAVFCGTWAASAVRGPVTTISAAAADDSINDSANGFLTAGFRVGHRVNITGFATGANNITNGTISSLTAGKMVISGAQGAALVTEAAGQSVTVTSAETTLKGGSTRRTFTFERRFTEIVQYLRYRGVEVDKLSLSVKPNAMVAATFSVVGRTMDPVAQTIIAGATYPNPNTNSPMDSFSGLITEGGIAVANVTEISLNLVNGISPMYVVGQRGAADMSIGRFLVTANIGVYFNDAAMLNKFINETESSMMFETVSAQGTYRWTLPRIKYTGGQPDVGNEGPVMLTMPITALYDATSATALSVERIPV